ncbi:MAG: hypothetical protein ABI852_08075, partial [Gemmatimonadaceae bacterium]
DSPRRVVVPTVNDTSKKADINRDSLFRVADSLKKLTADSARVVAGKPPAKTPAKKPAKQCVLNTDESPETARFTYARQNDSSSNLMVGGGFVGFCEGEKNKLKADSSEYYEQTGYVNLFGNVTYEDKGEFRVTANHATYFIKEGKLYADGNVQATQLKSGSLFVGPKIEYSRVMEGIRTTSLLYAPNNPLVQIEQKDSVGKPLPPVKVSASVMQDTGDSLLVAWGNVAILRTDVTGKSDSASYYKPTGNARLIRAANIQSTSKEQPFTLSGDTIDLFTRDSVLDRVLAKHLSKAKSGDVNMSAEMIDMRLIDKKIDRAYAYGPGRAKADTKDRNLEADSLDILLPNQLLREFRAFGTAVIISKPDPEKIKSEEDDVLRGDSVFAQFDSVKAKGDTVAKTQIKKVTAHGNASSKVQIASRQGPLFPPAINYIRGKHLVVRFDSGQVREIAVDSSASGSYYEPVQDSTLDTTKTKKPKKPPTISKVNPNSPSLPDLPSREPTQVWSRASIALLPPRNPRTR